MTRKEIIEKAHARIETALRLLSYIKSCQEEVQMLIILEEKLRQKINSMGFEK
jgi:hypothetical protein